MNDTVDTVGGLRYNVNLERIRSVFGLDDRGLVYLKNLTREVGQKRSDGYVRVTIDGEQIYEHILVYFLYHGEWPDYQLKHYDGDRSNNGIKNLLEEGERYVRMSKYYGVRFDPSQQSWITQVIDLNWNLLILGPFQTEVDAARAYDQEQIKMFGDDPLFLNGV